MSSLRARVFHTTAAIAIVTASWSASAFAGPSGPVSGKQDVDASVRPGDDFYRYANGAWLRETPCPEGLARYDSFSMLKDENARRVRALIEGAAKATVAGGAPANRDIGRKIGDYYTSWMDAAAFEAKGMGPLSGELAAIAAIADRGALSAYLGRTLHPDDGTNSATEGLFGAWIHQGFDQSDHYVPHLVQGGLGLPDRDDYLDPAKAERRSLYRAHVAAMLKLAGVAQSEARAERVLALEIAIARTHFSADDTADVFKTNNPWRRADFDTKAPGLDWNAYFKSAGLDRQDDFVVWQPSAIIGGAALVAAQPTGAWKDYLTFHLLEHYATVLPKSFGDEHFAFLGRLSGTQPPLDRARQAIAATNAALGEAVGRLYVERYFPPQAKAAAAAMVENIRAAYRARIANLTWMSPATKEKALAKLAALKVGLGYPDTWIDYSQLAVVRGDALGNLRRVEDFTWRRELAKLRRPVDPAEWPLEVLLPQMVNAIINFSPNAIQFSAGVLQPPFFDYAGDAASNYGSAGASIGHEISHSFDELGNVYDAQGRLVRWWTPEDLARYRTAWAPLVAQFDAYCPKPDLCVKGQQALSEDIADITGLAVAYDAYVLSLNGKPDAAKDGLTGDQRFFLAFARRWRRVQADAALRQQIATDIHPPGEYRSDTVRNLEAWRRAFAVKPGDRLYLKPEERVQMWR